MVILINFIGNYFVFLLLRLNIISWIILNLVISLLRHQVRLSIYWLDCRYLGTTSAGQ